MHIKFIHSKSCTKILARSCQFSSLSGFVAALSQTLETAKLDLHPIVSSVSSEVLSLYGACLVLIVLV